MKTTLQLLFVTLFLFLFACEEDEPGNMLRVDIEKIALPAEGGSEDFTLETDAETWSIDHQTAVWFNISKTSGTSGKSTVSVSVSDKTLSPRSDTLTINAGNARPVVVTISQAASEYLYELTVSKSNIEFSSASGAADFSISSGAPEWILSCDANWIELSQQNGDEGEFEISVNTLTNNDTNERSASIVLTGEGAPLSEIVVKQEGRDGYPDYNTNPLAPDITGMESSAMEIAGRIKIGWNIGNTLEAIGGETAWGNPRVTEELIRLVKQNGFNAIRIPCSWNQHLENQSNAKIKASWLNRVKEVVSYCVDNDMYVVLNIHWDGGWLENNCTLTKQEEVNAKQKAFWQQIATHLREFDEHLLFAGANEPNVENSTQMKVLQSYHQTFVDAVRATGGKNSYRVLVIQGPSTDIDKTNQLMKNMPSDEVEGRLMAEIHYYTPYQFCLMSEDASWGKMFYYWGDGYHSSTDTKRNATWGEEADLDNLLLKMNQQFISKGIPVILGEFAVIKRTQLSGDDLELHLASRAYFLKYLMQQSKANGILPFYWDAGNMGNNASALFNRKNNTVYDQQALDALMEGISN